MILRLKELLRDVRTSGEKEFHLYLHWHLSCSCKGGDVVKSAGIICHTTLIDMLVAMGCGVPLCHVLGCDTPQSLSAEKGWSQCGIQSGHGIQSDKNIQRIRPMKSSTSRSIVSAHHVFQWGIPTEILPLSLQ
jgi:hypothetical protein